MPVRVTPIDLPLGALFRRLAGGLMIGIMLMTTAIGLTHFNAVALRPGAESDFIDPPNSGLIISSEVVRLWLPETLVDPAEHEFPAQVGRTRHELKAILEPRGQENLWYAITVRSHMANHRAEEISFIRYPYRQPEYLPELMDILSAVAGSPPRHPSTDYSAASVHILPPGMSQREWLEATQASSHLRQDVRHEPDPK